MHILLVHALRSEAGIIRQHFPQATLLKQEGGQELFELDGRHHLLRTGVGLARAGLALQNMIRPDRYDEVISFGLSGSVKKTLDIHQLIQGRSYSAPDRPSITLQPARSFEGIPAVCFHSALEAVTDDDQRDAAQAAGGEAVDMESYAIAAFCEGQHIPLSTLRIISDHAGPGAHSDFPKYHQEASRILQMFILENILKRI